MTQRFHSAFSFLAVAILMTSTACDIYFADTETTSSGTYTTLDSRLPDALNEIAEVCYDPYFAIDKDDAYLDLLGACEDSTDLDSAQAKLIFAMLSIDGDDSDSRADRNVALDIPEQLFTQVSTIDGFSWPLQNCEIEFYVGVSFEGISFGSIESSWTTHSGNPALKMAFSNSSVSAPYYYHVASWNGIATVHCPSTINEIVLQQYINNVGLTDDGAIGLNDVDMNVYMDFEVSERGSINIEPHVSISLGSLYLTGINENYLPASVVNNLNEAFEQALDIAEEQLSAVLEEPLESLAEAIEDSMVSLIADDETVCSVEIDDNALVIHHSDDPDSDCVEEAETTTPTFGRSSLINCSTVAEEAQDDAEQLCESINNIMGRSDNCDEAGELGYQVALEECQADRLTRYISRR